MKDQFDLLGMIESLLTNEEPAVEGALNMIKRERKRIITKLAREFSATLWAWNGVDKMLLIVKENEKRASEGDRDTCASHDYCDPNQALIDVFEKYGFDAVEEVDLSNQVWDIAKGSAFKPNLDPTDWN